MNANDQATKLHPPHSWLDAWRFAAEVHNSQKVPDADLPYLHHLGRVALIVIAANQAQPIPDLDMAVTCAILHDAIEDQAVSMADLENRFGSKVAAGVLALSKQESLPKVEAMVDSLARIREQSQAIWCVKLADRIANMQTPPPHWAREKCSAYRQEAMLIHDALGSANSILAQWLANSMAAWKIHGET